jgi:hypothetical protein
MLGGPSATRRLEGIMATRNAVPQNDMSATSRTSVALIGSYVPRRCGIATFTHHLASAIAERIYDQPLESTERVRIVAVNDQDDLYNYGPEVAFEIGQHRKYDYRNAADFLNDSKFDTISLQHEYGLFGGEAGVYLLELLERLKKPIVSTLHTVLAEPNDSQRDVLRRVCDCSATLVVMAERARAILNDCYDISKEQIRLIHHGVPGPACVTRPRLTDPARVLWFLPAPASATGGRAGRDRPKTPRGPWPPPSQAASWRPTTQDPLQRFSWACSPSGTPSRGYATVTRREVARVNLNR